jgi:hypothetical protein
VAPDLFWRIKHGIDSPTNRGRVEAKALGYMKQLDKNASVKDVQATLDLGAQPRRQARPALWAIAWAATSRSWPRARTDTLTRPSLSRRRHPHGAQRSGGIKKPLMLHNPLARTASSRARRSTQIRETLKANRSSRVHEYAGQRSRVHARRRQALRRGRREAVPTRTIAFFKANLV